MKCILEDQGQMTRFSQMEKKRKKDVSSDDRLHALVAIK